MRAETNERGTLLPTQEEDGGEQVRMQRELDELKRMNSQLQQDRTVLQHVIDTVPFCIYWKDRNSVYLGGNRKKLTTLGMSSVDQLIGKTDFDTHPREDAERYRATDREVILSGNPRLNVEVTENLPEGPRVLMTNKVPLRNDAGEITGVLIVYEDITDRKHLEEDFAAKNAELGRTVDELRAAQTELVQAEKMAAIGTLAAGLSHELNNPLATILLHSQRLLKNMSHESPWRSAIEAIERQADRSGRLVNTLLEYSRQKPMTKEPVPVQAMIGRVVELAKSQLGGADSTLIVEYPELEALEVEACTQEMELALLNLVKNAIDATKETGGSIRIAARRAARDGTDGVEIAVCDTGAGIAPDVLPRIFDPFYTTKPVGKGTGLGLSLTKKIIDTHGGRIGVESDPGHGTEIRVWLAAARRSSSASATAPCLASE